MIGELISNYSEVGALGAFVLLMVWYVRYQTKRQAGREDKHDEERIEGENKRDEERKEEMLFNRNLITNDMKELHKDNIRNAELNKQSLVLQKDMLKSQTGLAKLIESVHRKINGRNK